MRRRDLIAGIGGAAAAWPLASLAQQRALLVIGYLTSGRSSTQQLTSFDAFREALSAQGYVEGRNLAIAYRNAGGRNEQLPKLAADLVSSHVAVLYAAGAGPALAAKSTTATIPIVFTTGRSGRDRSRFQSQPPWGQHYRHYLAQAITGKRLQLQHEMAPSATSIGLLADPTDANSKPKLEKQGLRHGFLECNWRSSRQARLRKSKRPSPTLLNGGGYPRSW